MELLLDIEKIDSLNWTNKHLNKYFSKYYNVLKGLKLWDKYIFFDKHDGSFLSCTTWNSKCIGFQTDEIELESYKKIPLMPDKDKNFGGSVVFDLQIWWHHHVKTLYTRSQISILAISPSLRLMFKTTPKETVCDGHLYSISVTGFWVVLAMYKNTFSL